MIVQTIKVNDCTPQTIVIGRRGTYDTLQIAFDLSYLVESYGNGVAVLAVKRSQDTSAYPAVTSQEDDLLLWTVSETDTFYIGAGECQLMWYVDGGLAKTIIYPMVVMKDILMTSEEAPDAYQEWIDALIAEGAETLQNAQDAAQSASDAEDAKDDAVAAKEAAEAILEEFTTPTASATTLSAGSQATATYSDGNFAFGIPRGADGDPGDPGVTPNFSIGTVTTLEPTQPATATITGTAEAPVLNLGIPKGAKGDPGQGGSSVDSVNGQTGDVVLDAGDLEFDDTETYAAGSIGAEVSAQKNAIEQKQDAPSSTGTAGQVLGLDSNLDPVWVNQSGGGDVSNCAPIIINTASGDIASFADGADGMQIRKIVGKIVPQQSGTGDPSPDNVRPISGWTGANIYNEETYDASATPKLTINWQTEAGTIYGGTVTLNEDGSADVVSDMASLDLGTLNWSYHSTQNRFDYDTNFGCKKPPNNSTAVNLICSIYIKSDANSIQNNNIAVNTTGYLRVKDTRYTTASAFKSAVSGQLVVYPLATPQTYHFDNIGQLYTYFGTNNVWIDTGAITECVYPADTKLYIDGLTAPDEDMIANANIASGKYFVVNNQLYLSTAAIAAGASIVPGTNCTATNLVEALNALNT